jgi:hypothetical protein
MQQCGELVNSSRERLHEEMLNDSQLRLRAEGLRALLAQGALPDDLPAFSTGCKAPTSTRPELGEKSPAAIRRVEAAGLKPMPALQHALLFGPYIEGMAGAFAVEGLPEFEATCRPSTPSCATRPT